MKGNLAHYSPTPTAILPGISQSLTNEKSYGSFTDLTNISGSTSSIYDTESFLLINNKHLLKSALFP